MIGRFIRDTVNLLLYGGTFIGLGAACMTALSFEITGNVQAHLGYILFVGTSTAALYCAHRVIGLKKVDHIQTSSRFAVIRKYKAHIWVYTVVWTLISVWLFFSSFEPKLLMVLIPGGLIAAGYVLPVLPGKKRLRDLGWGKILLIGWSWGWLTAFVPFFYFTESSLFLSGVHGAERILFIILITIPFEIRDIDIDHSMRLVTMPSLLGKKATTLTARLLVGFIFLFSLVISFHYLNPAYMMTMLFISLLTLPMIKLSYKIEDDFFFSGLVDGLMILALYVFALFNWLL